MLRTRVIAAVVVGVLAVAACSEGSSPTAAPIAVGSAGTMAAPSAANEVSITVKDFELDPSAVSVATGSVGFRITNQGPTVHNVTVRDSSGSVLMGSRDLREGESETVVGTLGPGTYVLFCTLPGHESLGVKGTLTVTGP